MGGLPKGDKNTKHKREENKIVCALSFVLLGFVWVLVPVFCVLEIKRY